MLIDSAPLRVGMVRVLRTARPRRTVERVLATIPATQWLDQAVFWLMYDTQLRVLPLCRLTMADLDLAGPLPLVRCGERWRLLTEAPTVTALTAYLSLRSPTSSCFALPTGLPLDLAYLDQQWRMYCQRAGVNCTLRELRGG